MKRMPGTKHLSDCLCNYNDKVFLDFLFKCFTWNPKERLTPAQALLHPFFEPLSGPSSPRLYKSDSTVSNIITEFLNPLGTPYYWDQPPPSLSQKEEIQDEKQGQVVYTAQVEESLSYAQLLQNDVENGNSDSSSSTSTDSRMDNLLSNSETSDSPREFGI